MATTSTRTRKQPLDHLRGRKKRVYRRVPIAMDSQVLENRDKARAEVARLDMQLKLAGNRPSDLVVRAAQAELREAKDALEEAEQALAEDVAWFHVESLGPKRFDTLVSMYPPSNEQRAEAKKDGAAPLMFNPETFPNALIPQCVYYVTENGSGKEVLTQLTDEFVEEMVEGEDWTQGEILELFEAALSVNTGAGRVGDLGNASRRTRRSG